MSLGYHLDESLDMAEEIRFKQKHYDLVKYLTKTTKFTKMEIEMILLIYYKAYRVIPKAEGITKNQLAEILHHGLDMTDYRMMDAVISAIDKSTSTYVELDKWVHMFSLFLKGTIDEKIQYAFDVCNSLTQNNFIARNTLLSHLRTGIIRESFDEEDEAIDDTVRDVVDMLLMKMDKDGDGALSFEEYSEGVKDCPLLLECFGPCLPTRIATKAFLYTFAPKIKKLEKYFK